MPGARTNRNPDTVSDTQQAPAKPAPPAPTLGRVLRYTLSPHDVHRIDDLRRDGVVMNQHHVGQELPAEVVREGDHQTVNLQVSLDGPRHLWIPDVAPSATGDPVPGCWHWPKIAR